MDVNHSLIKRLFWTFSIFALVIVAFIGFLWPILGVLVLLLLILIMSAVFSLKQEWWGVVKPGRKRQQVEAPVKGFKAEMMLESCVGQESIVINKPDMIIGRKNTCDHVLQYPNVSREHCRITYKDATHLYYIEDLDSAFGTFINAGRLPKHALTLLKPNSMVTLGDQHYIFKAIR